VAIVFRRDIDEPSETGDDTTRSRSSAGRSEPAGASTVFRGEDEGEWRAAADDAALAADCS
jgi:hypothetical protein